MITTMRRDPRRIGSVGVAALIALCFAGCVTGPIYEAPQSPLRTPLVGAAALAARSGGAPAPVLDAWWLGFADPVLSDIVQRVLEENLDLVQAMARVEQARAAAAGAHAARFPQASLDGQSLVQRESLKSPEGELASAFPGYDRTQTLTELGGIASWEADLAGGLKRGQEAAVDEWQAAEAGRTGIRVSVAAEAADAYFRIRGAQRRIAVAEDQIKTEDSLVGLVQDRLSGGLATNRELAQARALLLEARATVPPLRIELQQQTNRLDVLMGMQPGSFAQHLLSDGADYTVPTIQADMSPAQLLRRRPDVIAAERRVASSTARIGVATAEYYPKVSLAGILGFESLNSALFTSAAFQPEGLLGIHWRLFDFGRVDAEVAQARGANKEALAEFRLAVLRAAEDVEDAIVALTQLERQRLELNDEIAAHRTARDAAQDAYDGGTISLIEVLDEDRRLLRARDLLAQVDADDARAAVATFRALGGGWRPGGIEAPLSRR